MDAYLSIIYIFCAFLSITLGVAAFLFNKKMKSNQAFFLFSVSTGLWILSLFFLYYSVNPYIELLSLISVKLAYGFSLLMTFSFTIFMYYFPKKTIKFSRYIINSYIAINLLLIAITVFTPLIHREQIIINGLYSADKLGPLYFLYILFIVINFSVSMLIAIHKAISLSGIAKKKLNIVLFAFGTFGVIAILINVILPAFKIYFFLNKTAVLTLFFLIPAFYSIHKHRFFNISYIALESLRLFILLSVYIVTIISIYYFFIYLIPDFNDLMALILSILAGLYLWNKMQIYIPQLIIGDFTKSKKILSKLQASINTCSTYSELESLLEKYFVLDQNITSISLYFVRSNKLNINIPIYVQNNFTKLISSLPNKIYVKEEIRYLKLSKKESKLIIQKFEAFDASIIMPLFAEHKLIGFLILGSKEKNKLYTHEEINQILKIKPQLEIALTNFLLKLNLQEENNMMKELIEKKTHKLQEQFKEIKKLLEQQSDFIAVTAHEFRTPLSIAMFQLEDTLTTHEHTPQVIKDMEVMADSLNNLKNLTQKLFDVQQYDLNKIKLNKKQINLYDYLLLIFNEFKLIMKENKTEFIFNYNLNKNLEIEIDEHQIRQIFANLLNNAAKFADKSNPEIKIEANGENNKIQISIIDNGQGISDKDKVRVFEKFQTTKVTMGTGIGLGLYICKKIIELHNGKIWIEDNKPKGAKFIFELRK